MNYNYLYKLGLNQVLLNEYEEHYQGLYLGRGTVEHKGFYRVATEAAEVLAKVSGRYMFQALFICMALNKDFNLRKLERYLSQAWDSGAIPVVLLTKADLCDDSDRTVKEASGTAVGIDLITVSSVSGYGMDALKALIVPGRTYAFIGSSGVGKSIVVNYLTCESRLETQMVRLKDDKGRHTTTHRELIVLPSGGILIDTPGMRELQLLDISDSIDSSFSDIAELAGGCRFSDCTHQDESGCAVKAAIEAGLLSEQRFESYLKLKKEAAFIERKMNKAAASEYKEMIKKRNKEFRNRHKRLIRGI